jgi:hypothetical protein
MTTGMKTMLIAGATLGLVSGTSRAPAQEDPEAKMNYRCDNAKAHADAAELRCLDRCQRKVNQHSDSVRDQFLAVCADDCHQRCEDRKKKAESSPKCVIQSETANPQRCAGKHLGALARLNLCLSSCSGTISVADEQQTPEESTCQQHCNGRYTDAHDRINESDACALGGTPVCVYQ